MGNPQNLANTVSSPGRFPAVNAAHKTPRPETSSRYVLKRASAEPLRPERKTPATPLMLNPTAAWRLLCVRTGGAISLGTFYRWIRDGRVCTVRLGKKIMVPIPMLDLVIEKCLNGDDLL